MADNVSRLQAPRLHVLKTALVDRFRASIFLSPPTVVDDNMSTALLEQLETGPTMTSSSKHAGPVGERRGWQTPYVPPTTTYNACALFLDR